MYDRRVAALLNENDSNGEEVLWKAIDDGNTFLYPRLLFVITGKNSFNSLFTLVIIYIKNNFFFLKNCEGKGPEKEKYEEKIKKLNLKRVAFRTMWLTPEDYPLLLGE